MKTRLHIQYGGDRSRFGALQVDEQMVGLFLMVAVLFGMLVGVTLHERVPLPGTAKEQMAAPVSTPTLPSLTQPERIATIGEVAGVADSIDTPLVDEATLRAQEEAAATLRAMVQTYTESINAQELAITKITNEMTLIKNESVLLVAAFERDCGNWQDTCGTIADNKLEVYNTRYAELEDRLAEARRLIKDAEIARSLYQ